MMPTGSHLCMTTKKAVIVIHGYYFSVKEFGHNVFVIDTLICFISNLIYVLKTVLKFHYCFSIKSLRF